MSDADRPGVPGTDGSSNGAGNPPVDPRPKPKYGEYAPEGWTWTPPEPARPATPPTPAPGSWPAPAVPHAGPVAPGASESADPGKPARPRDLPVTIVLLILGLFGVAFAAGTILVLPESMAMLHAQYGLAAYEPGDDIGTVTTIGAILQVLLYVAVVISSVLRIRAGRGSWWLPIVGAVVSTLILFIVVSQVTAGDAALIEFFENGVPAPTP
ncbi:DUF6264 family protein [Agromyces seonyuensis]|uniref:Uncharacterized protein n=1 Tax=Agromyces seonyuensis TaxID=2662446 RepID=A0A6I4NV73_9MICO|nr:DUF6264 family protein [Agromyces seonyuensis]MWB98356.1 hypothetical protein [Agromyces seonyuensis]